MADKPDKQPQVKIPDRPHDWVDWSGEPGPVYLSDLAPADRKKAQAAMKTRSSSTS